MASFYEDASLVVIPSGYKTSKIYAEKPTDGSGDLTFTRASDATRVASNGLIEKVRTNLILQSQDFTTTWGAVSASVSANTTANPLDGAVNADTITFTGATTQKYVIQAFSFNGVYTVSAYLKAGTNQFVQFLLGSDAGVYVNFDLVNGTRSVAFGSVANMVSLGNGWYRCSMSFTSTTGTHVFIQAVDSLAATRFDTTSSTGTLIAFGYQLEVGDIATDYIPTTTAAVSVGPVSNVPRLDYLGSTCPRLNLEPQRTNLATFSEQLDNAAWTKETGNSVTANTTASPDGYVNADTISATDGNAININQAHTSASSSAHTFSTFLKKNNVAEVQIYIFSAGFISRATVNLDDGTITNVNGSGATITNYGNGWYRCSIQGVVNSGGGFTIGYLTSSTTGTRSVYSYGAQLEVGAYATSYIPTLGASVTRVADAASKTGISSLIGQTEGTIFVEGSIIGKESVKSNLFAALEKTSSGATMRIFYDGNSNIILADVFNGSTFSAQMIGPAIPVGQTFKAALAYKENDFALAVNGVIVATDNSGVVPTTDDLKINTSIYGNLDAGVRESQLLLFKTRLTNSQLAELTTL